MKKNKSVARLIGLDSDSNKENSNNCESSFKEESWLEKLKRPIQDFFIYNNNYIPIENSEQRKIVQRIRMIDFEAEQNDKENSKVESHGNHGTLEIFENLQIQSHV